MNSPTILQLVNQPIRELRDMIMTHVQENDRSTVLGPTLDRLLKSGSGKSLVTLALTSDFLRVMVTCILADRNLTATEVQYSYPFLGPASGLFAKYREDYKEYDGLNKAFIGDFLKFYANDSGLLGLQCRYTRWAGIQIVKNVASKCGDPAPQEFAKKSYIAFGTALKVATGGGPEFESILENVSGQFAADGDEGIPEPVTPDAANTDFEFDLDELQGDDTVADGDSLDFDLADSSSVEDEELGFDLANFELDDNDKAEA